MPGSRPTWSAICPLEIGEHTSELQSHRDLHSFPTTLFRSERLRDPLRHGLEELHLIGHRLKCRAHDLRGRRSVRWRSESTRLNSSPTVIYTLSLRRSSDLSGYVIHYGTVSKNYTSSVTVSNAGLTTYVVGDLSA